MPKAIDYTGHRFGRLVVTGEVLPRKAHRRMYVTCDCGTSKEVFLTSLKSDTQSCGCYNKEVITKHGEASNAKESSLYRCWINMRQRCNNPNAQYYQEYGGRGVVVCPEWDASFTPFKEWANNSGYAEGLTLDRKDNGLVYSPEHCHWVGRTAQQRNRRSHKGSTSNYIGVSLGSDGYYTASIKVGKSIYIGRFTDEVEAAKARDNYVKQHNLEHFTLNF